MICDIMVERGSNAKPFLCKVEKGIDAARFAQACSDEKDDEMDE